MQKRIVVIGAGFAGMWAALAAARLLDEQHVAQDAVEVVLIAPEPILTVRPRLYEADPGAMAVPLMPLFEVAWVRFLQGMVKAIRPRAKTVEIAHADGTGSSLAYDSLVLATGSRLFRPDVPGLHAHGFSVDQRDEAAALYAHCLALADQPDTVARNTAVVVGGGFTGIEIAAELPTRLRSILGCDVRVIVVEQARDIGPELGPGPRPVITEALATLGVECRLGLTVTAIDAHGLITSDGQRIEADTVVWTAGVRASALTAHIPAALDGLGRLRVDSCLRATESVFAAGDTANAVTDGEGHQTLMSCQHALSLGRFAGHNAAASLLGLPLLPYGQSRYVTGLDLGPWGAVHTNGWDRTVVLQGAESKARKMFVNSVLIYPPKPDRAEAFAAAHPIRP